MVWATLIIQVWVVVYRLELSIQGKTLAQVKWTLPVNRILWMALVKWTPEKRRTQDINQDQMLWIQLMSETMSLNSMLKIFNQMSQVLKKKNRARMKKTTFTQESLGKLKIQETQESRQVRITSLGLKPNVKTNWRLWTRLSTRITASRAFMTIFNLAKKPCKLQVNRPTVASKLKKSKFGKRFKAINSPRSNVNTMSRCYKKDKLTGSRHSLNTLNSYTLSVWTHYRCSCIYWDCRKNGSW